MISEGNSQLTLIQIGAFIGRYLPEYTLPQSLEVAAAIIQENLNITIAAGDSFEMIRKKVISAIKEHDELMLLGEDFYNMYTRISVEDEIIAAWAQQFANEIDREILNDLIEDAKENDDNENVKAFMEAMKVV